MASIKFLHLSDLHIGDKNQSGLISQVKKVLFEDIEFILSKLKTLDVVFFTGDFVQTGSKHEFELLEIFLKELWQLFKTKGCNPYLVCVPGNHDLQRFIDSNDPTQKILTNWIIEDIKDEYFWKAPNIYHNFIKDRFENYIEWYKNTSIPKPTITEGYIPGDFYSTIIVNELKLGIVGLNSTFLQIHGGDVKKKLGVYNKQANLLFKEEYFEWLKRHDLTILLTHHSSDWFESKSFEEFNSEIYTKDSFIEHLCGHMHEPSYTNMSINGFPNKRQFIAPSLFGLESNSRIHGYTAGSYDIEPTKITKTIWPRISIKTKSGLKISQNEEFNLEKDSLSFKEVLADKHLESNSVKDNPNKISNFTVNNGNLFEKNALTDIGLAKTLFKDVNSHKNVRLQERNFAVNNLIDNNYCWIVTTFGLGEDEFIGSIISDSNINPLNCFSVNCDEVKSKEELIEVFKKTFSKNITQFFDIINCLNQPLVVFNHINDSLLMDTASIKDFIQTLFDFSPNSKFIFVSENTPDIKFFDYVELTPLDIPAVKHFIEGSKNIQSSFTFLEYEKIHRISSGIPLYIDKVIEQLAFRPLSDLGEMEFDITLNKNNYEILPKALINEIKLLQSDDSKQGCRRFLLLTALSLLHNGETYERIRKFDSTLPFYPEDILFLINHKLIETLQVNSIFDDRYIDNDLIKIIRVPRVIRDYISSILSTDEKVLIYKKVFDLYLGSNWRTNIKLPQTKDAELDLIVHQNLQISVRFILLNSIENSSEIEVNRITRISLYLIDYFTDRGSYKDAISLAEEILLLIKNIDYRDIEKTRTKLMIKLGENLRMTSIHDKSIGILKSICDDETNSLSNKDRNDLRLSIAYVYEIKENKNEALKYANLIKQNEKDKDCVTFLSAESVIAHFIENDSERLKKLNAIKNKAEKKGYNTLKANLILDIYKNSKDENQLKMIDKIIVESKNDTYNKVRALVAKADIILSTKNIDNITEIDLYGLNISYSYCFYQRLLALLNKCHRLAWEYWSMQNRYDQLLNIFRYSSFVWRLCGSSDQEQKYIDELHSNQEFLAWFKNNKDGINSTYYEQRIFALYQNTVAAR